ncbi:MAG: ATP-grasp domain-containing protein [Phycisphaerales bacterium]
MKKRRVLLLVREDFVPPESIDGLSDKEIKPWKGEFDVREALLERDHLVEVLGVDADLDSIRSAVDAFQPHVVFNLLEEFAREPAFVAYLLGYFEMRGVAYTGCNPIGLLYAADKARQQRVMRQHRIQTPGFFVVPRGKSCNRPKRMEFPLIVKSLTSHGSLGVAQASVVHDDEALQERVVFIHETMATDAIVERYIDGRELYVGVIGNKRLETLPVWELLMKNLPKSAPFVATEKVKWDVSYQQKVGLTTGAALGLDEEIVAKLRRVAKRAYRALEQSGYARMDFRVTDEGRVYLMESNPNCDLTFGEDFARSAEAAGIEYPALLERIVRLGERWAKTGR